MMTHIERHTLLMRKEVSLEHIRAEHDFRLRSLEHFKTTERSHRRQEYHTIKTDISPKTSEDKLDWFHGRVCEGTGRWLMRDTTFAKWLDSSDTSTRIVWLQGIPGAGVSKSRQTSFLCDPNDKHGQGKHFSPVPLSTRRKVSDVPFLPFSATYLVAARPLYQSSTH